MLGILLKQLNISSKLTAFKHIKAAYLIGTQLLPIIAFSEIVSWQHKSLCLTARKLIGNSENG